MRAPTPTISAADLRLLPRTELGEKWTPERVAAISQLLHRPTETDQNGSHRATDLCSERSVQSAPSTPINTTPPTSISGHSGSPSRDEASEVADAPQPELYTFNPQVLREVLFAAIHDLSESQDDKLRLAAALGGLKALAQLEALELRKQRLQQQRELIDIARAHLELLQRREQRREELHAARPLSHLDLHCPRGTALRGGDSAHDLTTDPTPPTPLLQLPTSDLPLPTSDAPLTEDEVNEARDRFPGVQPHRYRLAELTRYWRNKIREDRHKDAVLAARRAHTAPAPTAPAPATRAPAAANPPPTSSPSYSSSTTSASSPPTQPEAPPPPHEPRPPDP